MWPTCKSAFAAAAAAAAGAGGGAVGAAAAAASRFEWIELYRPCLANERRRPRHIFFPSSLVLFYLFFLSPLSSLNVQKFSLTGFRRLNATVSRSANEREPKSTGIIISPCLFSILNRVPLRFYNT